jgi:hypothetical protein
MPVRPRGFGDGLTDADLRHSHCPSGSLPGESESSVVLRTAFGVCL